MTACETVAAPLSTLSTARQIGMQFYNTTRDLLSLPGNGGFAAYMERMLIALGDRPDVSHAGEAVALECKTLKLHAGLNRPSPAIFDAWNGLWEGACAAHDRRLTLNVDSRRDTGGDAWRWRVA